LIIGAYTTPYIQYVIMFIIQLSHYHYRSLYLQYTYHIISLMFLHWWPFIIGIHIQYTYHNVYHPYTYHYSITICQYQSRSWAAKVECGVAGGPQWLRSSAVGWWLVGWCWVSIIIQYSGDHNPLWEYIFTRVMYNWDGVCHQIAILRGNMRTIRFLGGLFSDNST
jgi:hypothetical protein